MGTFLREQDRAALGIVPAAAVPPNTVRPLTAAAARIRIDDKLEAERIKKRRTGSTWQGEAWAYFDMIGEVKYAFMLAGAVLSRIKLYVGHADTPSAQPSRLHDVPGLPLDYLETAEKHFQRLDTGFGGIPGLLREACINLSVPGECYLVQEKAKPASGIPEKWTIRSVDEVEIGTDGKASMRTSAAAGNQALEPLQEGSFIGRIWRPHPRYHDEADSSMRSLLTLCAELLLLNRTVRATAKSRLNAGALFIPDGLSVAAAPDTVDDQGTVDTDDDDTFEQELLAAMTLPIQDEDSASAVVPLLIRGPAELGSQIRPIKFERSFDAALAERADKVLDRILQGLDIPKDVVTGLSNVKYALSTDSEILTREGWKTYTEVAVGDDVYTLNHTTGRGEWQPLLEINVHDHDGPMLAMDSATHSSLSTPEHRWATVKTGTKVKPGTERRWTTSAEGFAASDRVETAAECGNLPTETKYTDDFVRLVALYTSDGWLETPDRGGPRANITKTARNRNPGAVGLVRAVVGGTDPGHREYPLTSTTPDGRPVAGTRFRLSPEASGALFAVAGGTTRIVAYDFIDSLTYAQLNLFLDTLVEAGDGNLVDGRMDIRRYWQTERERLEPIAMAAVLAGYTVRWLDKPITPGPAARVPGSRPCWGLTITKAVKRFSPYAVQRRGGASWEHYTGKVWCPTTPNRTWLARRRGKVFFTGNSNAVVIQESLYRTHIEPLALLICDALTMMFMRPAMASLGFPEETVNRTIVWYDPTDILTSADRAQNSDSGYDKFLLSGATWRAAHGFAETDAPTGEELLNRIVVSRGQVSPELTEAVLSRIAPDSFAEAREAALAGKSTEFPDSLEDLLETGRLPEPPEGEEPLPPEILEGLPIPSPTPPDAEQPAGVGTGDAPPPPGTEDADAGKPAI